MLFIDVLVFVLESRLFIVDTTPRTMSTILELGLLGFPAAIMPRSVKTVKSQNCQKSKQRVWLWFAAVTCAT